MVTTRLTPPARVRALPRWQAHLKSAFEGLEMSELGELTNEHLKKRVPGAGQRRRVVRPLTAAAMHHSSEAAPPKLHWEGARPDRGVSRGAGRPRD